MTSGGVSYNFVEHLIESSCGSHRYFELKPSQAFIKKQYGVSVTKDVIRSCLYTLLEGTHSE